MDRKLLLKYFLLVFIIVYQGLIFGQNDQFFKLPFAYQFSKEDLLIKIYNTQSKEYVDHASFSFANDCDPCLLQIEIRPLNIVHEIRGIAIDGVDSVQIVSNNSKVKLIEWENESLVFESLFDEPISFDVNVYSKRGSNQFVYLLNDFILYDIELGKSEINQWKIILSNASFFGILFFIFLFNFLSFFLTRRKETLFYSFYIFTVFVFVFAPYLSILIDNNDQIFNLHYKSFSRSVQALFYVFYYPFLIYFLDVKNKYPKLGNLLRYLTIFALISFFITYGLFSIQETELALTYFSFYRLFIGLVSIGMIIYMLQFVRRDSNALIMVIGGSILVVGSLVAMVFSIFEIIFLIFPIWYMYIAIFLEVVIFSTAMTYKFYLAERQNTNIKDSLISQLKVSESILEKKKSDLEQEISDAKESILLSSKQRIKTEYDLELKELELIVLRTQLNPHFVFNSMNSLKRFILENKTDLAVDYVDSFASLFRKILEFIKKQQISLEEEIEFLNEYISLENLRLNGAIQYTLNIDEEIDTAGIKIPVMLIQTIVENAIWHGLSNQIIDPKILQLSISRTTESLIRIDVEDNGMGYKKKQIDFPSSNRVHSTEINLSRLGRLYGPTARFTIESPLNVATQRGTKASFYLPI